MCVSVCVSVCVSLCVSVCVHAFVHMFGLVCVYICRCLERPEEAVRSSRAGVPGAFEFRETKPGSL